MANDKYNGWTNRETWLINLWIGNDEGSQRMWDEQAQRCYDAASASKYLTREEEAARNLEDTLKEYHEGSAPLDCVKHGVYADLLSTALASVNWREIAEHMIENIEKEEPESATE